jgi:hypothetical protein
MPNMNDQLEEDEEVFCFICKRKIFLSHGDYIYTEIRVNGRDVYLCGGTNPSDDIHCQDHCVDCWYRDGLIEKQNEWIQFLEKQALKTMDKEVLDDKKKEIMKVD